MLRRTLLATTAMVLCASLAHGQMKFDPTKSRAFQKMLAIGRPGTVAKGLPSTVITTKRGSQPVHNTTPNLENAIFSNYSKDANAQYISWYGYTARNTSSCVSYSTYHSCYHLTADNAFAFTPAATKTTKNVTVALFSFFPSAQYQVDIYSSVGSLPGSVIAHSRKFAASDTSLCCTASRTVTIKANLTAGTQYFIGVVGVCCNAYGGWNLEDTDFSGAAIDYYHTKHTSSYGCNGRPTVACSSPWHPSTFRPSTGAVILK